MEKITTEQMEEQADNIIKDLLKHNPDEFEELTDHSNTRVMRALAFKIKELEYEMEKSRRNISWPKDGHDW